MQFAKSAALTMGLALLATFWTARAVLGDRIDAAWIFLALAAIGAPLTYILSRPRAVEDP